MMYLLLFWSILIASSLLIVYAMVLYLSHNPRKPFPLELRYYTNDDKQMLHELLPTINSTLSTFEDHGIDISIVIPCFNETNRLGRMLNEAIEYLQKHYLNAYEILIVDDGSSDGTAEFALMKAQELKLPPHILKLIKLEKNRGKGGAVTHGLLHCSGRLALFADADGATKFQDIERLIEYLDSVDENEAAVAIGSRAHMVNTDAVVRRSFIRNFLMYGLHTLVFLFGIRGIQDTQCGFKMFNFQSIQKIFPHMHTERWIFDVEVLLLGEIQGMKMKEIAVNWKEVDGSKIDLARDSIGMAVDLVVTRLAYLMGIYKVDECGGLTKKDQ